MRILIVDDDDISLDLLSCILKDAGYEVETAQNGDEALGILKSGSYHLVLLDWIMPGMSGIELCRKIRSESSTNDIYVILITTLSQPNYVMKSFREGANDFITKPVEPDELCLRVSAGERKLLHKSCEASF